MSFDRYNELRWEEIQRMEFDEKLKMIEKDLTDPETLIGWSLFNAIKDFDIPADAELVDKLDYLTKEQFAELKEEIDDYIYSFEKVEV